MLLLKQRSKSIPQTFHRTKLIVNKHSDEFAIVNTMIKEMEEKSVVIENTIAEVKATTESNTLNISLNYKQDDQIKNDGKSF